MTEQEEPAVLEYRDCRQWCLRQARPGRPDRPGLEPVLLCAAQHFCDADSGRSQPMTELRLLGRDAVNPQQHGKREEPLVVVVGHVSASVPLSQPRDILGCRRIPSVPPMTVLRYGESAAEPTTQDPGGADLSRTPK